VSTGACSVTRRRAASAAVSGRSSSRTGLGRISEACRGRGADGDGFAAM
jgi:hypothetical protein